MTSCVVCHKLTGSFIHHHVNYSTDEVVPVHRKCHSKIHHTELYSHLKPIDKTKIATIVIPQQIRIRLDELKNRSTETYHSVIKRLLSHIVEVEIIKKDSNNRYILEGWEQILNAVVTNKGCIRGLDRIAGKKVKIVVMSEQNDSNKP